MGARRSGEPPVHHARARAGHQLLRHRRHVFARRERGGARPRAEGLRDARSGRHRDEGVLSDGRRPERSRAVAQAHHATRSTRRCAGSAPTTSTSTRSTASIHETPIEETLEALHDVVKAGKARYIGASSMFAWQFAKMLARRRRARLDAVRLDAEPLQPRLPRGRARDDAALPRGRHRRDSVEPAGARLSRRQPPARAIAARRTRAKTDEFAHKLYYADSDFTIADRVVELAARRGVKPTQIALAWLLAQAGRHRADRRRVEAAAPRRRDRRARHPARRRRDRISRGAVPAAPGSRPL